MQASDRQLRVFEEFENTGNNILINSVAGSGKTTTLIELIKRCDKRVLFVAFNRSIEKEINQELANKNLTQGKAFTMHSLGYKAISETKKSVNLDTSKYFEISKEIREEYRKEFKRIGWENTLKFLNSLRIYNEVSRLFLTNDLLEIFDYAKSMGHMVIDFSNHYVKELSGYSKILLTKELIEKIWLEYLEKREKSFEGDYISIDYTDMIYYPAEKGLTPNIDPYYIFVDEAQDLGYAQHRFLDLLLALPNVIKWVAVGDPLQSIYSFAGSFPNSFYLFKEKLNVVELPLDICYRCDKLIVNKVNEIYPVMQAFQDKGPGIVTECTSLHEIENDSIVICRNVYPLIDIYFKLLSLGKKPSLVGDDILNSVKSILKSNRNNSVGYILEELKESFTANAKSKDDNDRLKAYLDKESYKVLKSFVSFYLENRVTAIANEVLKIVESIPKTSQDNIKLMSIHKSKGLGAKTVYIVNESALIPSKYAVTPDQLQQETNLKYVARSRAKNKLVFLNLEYNQED